MMATAALIIVLAVHDDNLADIDDEVIYQASEQYRVAEHANNFIKNNRGNQDEH